MTDPSSPSPAEASTTPAFTTYVDHAAAVVGLSIPLEYRQGVIENFERIAAIAPLVMDFSIPDDTEVAPIFSP